MNVKGFANHEDGLERLHYELKIRNEEIAELQAALVDIRNWMKACT